MQFIALRLPTLQIDIEVIKQNEQDKHNFAAKRNTFNNFEYASMKDGYFE